MAELRFLKQDVQEKTASCCGTVQNTAGVSSKVCSTADSEPRPKWMIGSVTTDAGIIPVISTDLTGTDHWEHIKCRASGFRDNYIIPPGLYAVGAPDRNSDVFVSANYKLSFDCLRNSLKGLNGWVLVLDTKGINVWCAAGKGTFGTSELIRRISVTELSRIVEHRRVIVPQLGAPGISAQIVRKTSGFRVCYGPVISDDIGAFISAGYKATREMRTIKFPMIDRLVLTPMEINPAMKKYYPWYALIILVAFGLRPEGVFFGSAIQGGLPFLLLGLVSILSGALLTPLFLPFIPFRSFAIKGWIMGIMSIALFGRIISQYWHFDPLLTAFIWLFFPLVSSYVALQFTGSTTFTGMSGVKKELKTSIPVYISGAVVSVVLLSVYKVSEWGLI